jgi:hypothetical protein
MNEKYENFPLHIVILSNTLSILIYGIGLYIIFKLNWILGILYLVYCLILEFRIVKTHCVNYYYWGKVCGFGKSIISSRLFKKGDPSKFCSEEMTWSDMIPDILVTLLPLIAGIVVLILNFNYLVLLALIILILLTSYGNGFVRGSLTCKLCKQKELGCPADKLFNKQ